MGFSDSRELTEFWGLSPNRPQTGTLFGSGPSIGRSPRLREGGSKVRSRASRILRFKSFTYAVRSAPPERVGMNLSANCCWRAIIQTWDDSIPANPSQSRTAVWTRVRETLTSAGIEARRRAQAQSRAMSIAFNVRKAIKQLIWLAVLFGLAGCSANRGGHAVTLRIRGSEYDADAGASLGGIVREGGLEREA